MSNRDKYEFYIQDHIRNQRVLDVGCVQHTAEAAENDGWMHGLLWQDAKTLIGVDNQAEEVAKVNHPAYDIRVGDAHDLTDLDVDPFDVVFAGELIEHLDNFDAF